MTVADFQRQENENDDALFFRIVANKDKIGSWDKVADILNEIFGKSYSESKYRKEFKRKYGTIKIKNTSNFTSINNDFEDTLKEDESVECYDDNSELLLINKKIRELKAERIKFQTEKLEYNKWLREEARDDLITEKIVDAIKSSNYKISTPPFIQNTNENKNRTGVLIFGDEHFGTQFQIRGLYGEIINSYSPEIFESRMWDLFDQVKNIIEKERLTNISVYSMGDFVDGILRVKQLFTLKYGVIEGSVIYSKFIVNWLNELTKLVYVRFQMVYGNHSELRLLSQPKGTFENENTGIIEKGFIETCLLVNPNFEFIQNPTGLIFENIYGWNILGIHGEVKNMANALKDFSNTYKTPIDYLIGGHVHHDKSETIGVNKEVINVSSLIGIDNYSISLNKTSNAGALFIVFREGYGIEVKYPIKLN